MTGMALEEIMKKLEQGVSEVFMSEHYQSYLKMMARFHHYSVSNSILIWLQKPEATLVAGFSQWQKQFHRYVRKGETGIRIIAPIRSHKKENDEADEKKISGYRAAVVFDISQTEGEELPSYTIHPLEGNMDSFPSLFEAIILASPVPVSIEEINGSAYGFYQPKEKRIVIREGMSPVHQTKTLLHEIAHARLHGEDYDDSLFNKEVEAESVAYAVSSYYGIDTSLYSFPYIAGWSKEQSTKELKASMERIRKTSSSLIETINSLINPYAFEQINPLLMKG